MQIFDDTNRSDFDLLEFFADNEADDFENYFSSVLKKQLPYEAILVLWAAQSQLKQMSNK